MLITIKEFAAELGVNPKVLIEKLSLSGIVKQENDFLSLEDKNLVISNITEEKEVKNKKLGLKKKPVTSEPNKINSVVNSLDDDTPKIEIKRKKNLVKLDENLELEKIVKPKLDNDKQLLSEVEENLKQDEVKNDISVPVENEIITEVLTETKIESELEVEKKTDENETLNVVVEPVPTVEEIKDKKKNETNANLNVLEYEDSDNKKGKSVPNKSTKKTHKMKVIGVNDSGFEDIIESDPEVVTVLEQIPENIKLKFNHSKRHDKPKSIKIPRIQEFQKPTQKQQLEIIISEFITVSDLGHKMAVKSSEVIKCLMKMGMMVTINQALEKDIATIVVEEFGHKVKLSNDIDDEYSIDSNMDNSDLEYKPRAAIVTIMGHVDHGKTSLLDRIRKTKVAHGEAGGITQHIGAYLVDTGHGKITFLDTPGHEAFTQLRARGSKVTDIVILVVAADDGVMPQTVEAINHAKAASVPIIIAVNKMDKPGANPEKVKQELGQFGIIPEEWGGNSIFVNISALTGMGIDKLLDSIILQAELLELKAPENTLAKGIIIESKLDKGRGAVVSVLVQQGVLRKSDYVLAGITYGKVKALYNELGKQVESAGPSTPVEVLGFADIPNSGDELIVVKDERKAREIAAFRLLKKRTEKQKKQQSAKLENLFIGIKEGSIKQLPIIVKS